MATVAENLASLETSRSNIIAELATIETDTPNYSVDGQSVEPRRKSLLDHLDRINALIAQLDNGFSVFSAADSSY